MPARSVTRRATVLTRKEKEVPSDSPTVGKCGDTLSEMVTVTGRLWTYFSPKSYSPSPTPSTTLRVSVPDTSLYRPGPWEWVWTTPSALREGECLPNPFLNLDSDRLRLCP